MKNIFKSHLIIALTFSMLTACTSNEISAPILEQQTSVISSSNSDTFSPQSITTVHLIVDKYAKTNSTSEKEKLAKDFKLLIKNINYETLLNLIHYVNAAKLNTIKQGETQTSHFIKIEEIMFERLKSLGKNISVSFTDLSIILSIYSASSNPDQKKIDEAFAKFEKSAKKLNKSEARELMNHLNDEPFTTVIPHNTPAYKRISNILMKQL